MLSYNEIFNEMKKITNYEEYLKNSKSYNNRYNYKNYDEIGFKSSDIRNINTNSTISYYRKIYSNKKMIFFVKRVIRKLVKFVVEPITIDISNYNRSNTKIVMQLIENNQKLHNQYNQLKKENELLVERIIEIEKSLKK